MNILQEQLAPTAESIAQERMPLFNALVKYAKSNTTPFDVPGHKMGGTR